MRVQLPDGKIAEFPDTMQPAEIESVIKQQYNLIQPEAAPSQEPRATYMSDGQQVSGRQFAGDVAPVVGDIALAAVAPQLKGSQFGIKAINALMRAGYAGAGGGIGEYAGQQIAGEPTDFNKVRNQALIGGGADLAMSGAFGAGKYAWDKVGRPTLNLISEFLPTGERLAAKGVKALQKRQKVFEAETTQKALNFIDSMKGGASKPEAGIKIGDAIAGKKDFKEVYREYNELIDKAAGERNELILDDFGEKIAEIVDFGGKESTHARKAFLIKSRLNVDSRTASIIADVMENTGYLDKEDAKYLLAKLHRNFGQDTATQTALKEELKDVILTDIGNNSMTGQAAKEAKKKADDIFKATQQWFRENPSANYIIQDYRAGGGKFYENLPEKAVDRIFSAPPDQVLAIKTEILKTPEGKHVWAGAEFSYLNEMFEKWIKKTDDTGKRRLLPAALADEIYSREEFIKKVMPDVWPKLKAEADYYKSIAPQFESISVNDIFGAMSAWEAISPKSKKLVEEVARWAGPGKRGLGATPIISKGVLHLGADE